jgi:ApbE superfamily uncharacterized protein (UPF0280 family)
MSGLGGGAAVERLGAQRWHFQHGPIDLIIDVQGDACASEGLIGACWDEFQGVLPGLVQELPALRRAVDDRTTLRGPVARRMLRACRAFAAERFITSMAAVAGAVSDHLITRFEQPGIQRACINNGGDIAIFLAPGASFRVGICSHPEAGATRARGVPLSGAFTIDRHAPVRGIATSGWRGRSFSLGVADSVTVLAADAATADAAATLIGNAVNCQHPGIVRAPADQLKDDTDLGSRLVTVDVPRLPPAAVDAAVLAGRAEAELWRERGLIFGAAIALQGRMEVVMPASNRPLFDMARGDKSLTNTIAAPRAAGHSGTSSRQRQSAA